MIRTEFIYSLLLLIRCSSCKLRNERPVCDSSDRPGFSIPLPEETEAVEPTEGFVANALINFEYAGKVPIWDQIGLALGSIQNEEKNEDYFSLQIGKDSMDFFGVRAKREISEHIKEGGVHKADCIGPYAANYEPGMKLSLYQETDYGAAIEAE